MSFVACSAWAIWMVLINLCNTVSAQQLVQNETSKEASSNVTSYIIDGEKYSFHPVDEGPYIVSQYSVTCCRNGTPTADPKLAPYLHEWTEEMVGELKDKSCRRFNGYYSLPKVIREEKQQILGVRCKCPDEEQLDRNCRYLPECANGGYRSFSINLRCVCPPQWFGELCEKFCLNGVLYKNADGIDSCQCATDFFGEACDQIRCYNGGSPIKGRACVCPLPYIGTHCQEMSNSVFDGTGAQPSSFHRDLSGTVVSLFLAVALGLGVYFLVRRRSLWMHRRLRLRRAMMAADAAAADAQPPPDYHGFPTMRCNPAGGATQLENGAFSTADLPPPPAYNDVVKAPPSYSETFPQSVQATEATCAAAPSETTQRPAQDIEQQPAPPPPPEYHSSDNLSSAQPVSVSHHTVDDAVSQAQTPPSPGRNQSTI